MKTQTTTKYKGKEPKKAVSNKYWSLMFVNNYYLDQSEGQRNLLEEIRREKMRTRA